MRTFAPDRLDRYALRLFVSPLVAVLAILLIAQLLERLLRLFDLAASAGAPVSSVAVMFFNLVPHYLGLALPMAFTAAIFMSAARLSDDNELDVMLTTGRSLARIAAPYFVLALLLVPFNFILFGELQPLTRYGYHVAVNAALETGWNAKVEENRFAAARKDLVFSANEIEADRRHLHGVFVERRLGDTVETTTSKDGQFVSGSGGRALLLRLEDGVILREKADAVTVDRFVSGRVDRDLLPAQKPYRARGESVRELTLAELWRGEHGRDDDVAETEGADSPVKHSTSKAATSRAATPKSSTPDASISKASPSNGPTSRTPAAAARPGARPAAVGGKPTKVARPVPPDAKPAAELHGRLARVFILPLLPLLALPLGIASKRGRRTPGVVFATLALLSVNHALQLGQSLAENGRLPAALAVWTPFTLFAVLCVWIFRSSLAWPGDNPVSRTMLAIENFLAGIWPRRRAPAAA